jgi:hypothetical protein
VLKVGSLFHCDKALQQLSQSLAAPASFAARRSGMGELTRCLRLKEMQSSASSSSPNPFTLHMTSFLHCAVSAACLAAVIHYGPRSPPDYVGFAVPFFLLQIACEVALGLCTRNHWFKYDLADSISSIGAGSIDQLFFKLVLQPIAITSGPYRFIHETYGMPLPAALPVPLQLLILILLVDFGTCFCAASMILLPCFGLISSFRLLLLPSRQSRVQLAVGCTPRAPHQRVLQPHHCAAAERLPELLFLADLPPSRARFPPDTVCCVPIPR